MKKELRYMELEEISWNNMTYPGYHLVCPWCLRKNLIRTHHLGHRDHHDKDDRGKQSLKNRKGCLAQPLDDHHDHGKIGL